MTPDEFLNGIEDLRKFGIAVARNSGVPPDDREDIVQSCLTSLWKNHEHYHTDETNTLKALMITAVKRRAISSRRHEKPLLVGEDAAVFDVPTLMFTSADDDERLKPVELAINSLKPLFRQVIYLRYLKNLSFLEIAAETGVAESTLRTYHLRALAQVRKALARS